MLIGGKPSDAASGRTFETQNPFTGAPWATVPDCGPDDVDAAVAAARSALDGEWGADPVRPRRLPASAGRPDHRERRDAGPDRGQRLREAVPGDDRPARACLPNRRTGVRDA
ncbi:aldehyde dehydrogenase family protein [Pseudonocardia sp. ICBG601]|uniref:aldehyde dehydrogenase family protein n=1 Tax=Pseudonocardia sp. ICBG601 TaxID=2846759 RepID=UPI0035ABF0F1